MKIRNKLTLTFFIAALVFLGPIYLVLSTFNDSPLIVTASVTGGLVMILAGVLAVLAWRQISGRIARFENSVDKLSSGRLEPGSAIDAEDELANSLKAFARMARRMNSSRDELKSSGKFVDNILSSMPDALFIVDRQLQINRVNRAACDLTGRPEDELLFTPFHLLNGEGGVLELGEFAELSEKGSLCGVDGVCLSKSGNATPVSTSGSAIVSPDGVPEGFVFVVRDTTQRKEFEEQLTRLSLHDPLTGLSNRLLLRERIAHALHLAVRTNDQLAVLYLDIDDFKTINDSLGHSVGDKLLLSVAERLKELVRATDTVARVGGDEFAMLIERPSEEHSGHLVADRIQRAMKQPVVIDDREIFVSLSIGVAAPLNRTETAEDLLRNADVAMYIAKKQAKGNHILFEPTMHSELIKRIEIETDLRAAVKQEQFFLQYQPIVDLETGQVRGVEALLRWQHPKRGLVPPMDFIPVAESTGIILEMGRWILRNACCQGRIWYEDLFKDKPFSLMINLSAREFQDADLTETVANALVESGLPPQCLVLEITENMMMTNTEAMIDKLRRLRHLGVRLAIDDFGTGFSSLNHMESLPVDILKIDKSFTARLSGGPTGSALVKAIISMCDSLNFEALAEGIEQVHQINALRDLGCKAGQGYHFTRPLDGPDMSAFLRTNVDTTAFDIVPEVPCSIVGAGPSPVLLEVA